LRQREKVQAVLWQELNNGNGSAMTTETDPPTEPTEDPSAQVESAPSPEAAPLTPDEVQALQAKAAKADEHWNGLLRTTADFENYKKRAARERLEAQKYATESLLEKLIPVMDNFEMAMLAAQAPTASVESLRTGVSMIHQQLRATMAENGLTELIAHGQKFDPNVHEAVSQQPSSEVPEGHVLQQLRKGYRLRERLLRPATVVVAQKPVAE
jgi:molecular chaperone GrpE